MPNQRKLWRIRQLYGNIPPTDPRFLALTKEQIDLDLVHNMLDAEERKAGGSSEAFVDENYDENVELDEIEDDEIRTDGLADEASSPDDIVTIADPSTANLFNDDEWEDCDED